MGVAIEEVVTARRSPWQSPFMERLIGSVRRECLNHVVVFHERHLRRLLCDYFAYYHRSRVNQALDVDCQEHRPVQKRENGSVVEIVTVHGSPMPSSVCRLAWSSK